MLVRSRCFPFSPSRIALLLTVSVRSVVFLVVDGSLIQLGIARPEKQVRGWSSSSNHEETICVAMGLFLIDMVDFVYYLGRYHFTPTEIKSKVSYLQSVWICLPSQHSHTGAKILNLSKNSHFENPTFHKIHNFKVSFFAKFTIFKHQILGNFWIKSWFLPQCGR